MYVCSIENINFRSWCDCNLIPLECPLQCYFQTPNILTAVDFQTKLTDVSCLSHTLCCVSPLFSHPNNVSPIVQTVTLLVVEFRQVASCWVISDSLIWGSTFIIGLSASLILIWTLCQRVSVTTIERCTLLSVVRVNLEQKIWCNINFGCRVLWTVELSLWVMNPLKAKINPSYVNIVRTAQ